LHALLEDCLKAQSKDEPTLIVIEDMHWIDALSHDLLEQLARALTNHAVCFVLAYRPPQLDRLQQPRIEVLEQFTRIELHELTQAEAESAVHAKLGQLYPERGGALPEGLVEVLTARAQGNPFYLEELLNYVRDRSIDLWSLQDPKSLLDLPDSLHTLILSRIDQLSEDRKTTLRVASIIGRLFRAKWLTGYYPELGAFPQVKEALDALEALDITPLDTPEPELAYLFKHIVTHEVTYESLPFATRARLHEQLAQYLESVVGAEHAPPLLDTIVFHYLRSENRAKQMEYLRKAGEASQKNFANDAALEYYGQLLPLLNDDKEKAQILLKRGEVLQLMGKWDETESDYRAALDSPKEDDPLKASAQLALGKLNIGRGEYATALEWLEQAKATYMKLDDDGGLTQTLLFIGTVYRHTGEYDQRKKVLDEAFALAQKVGDNASIATSLSYQGLMAMDKGDYPAARKFQEESIALRRELGDRIGIANSLGHLGTTTFYQGDYITSQEFYEECLKLKKEIGDKSGIAGSIANLGMIAQRKGDYISARKFYQQALALHQELGNKKGISSCLNNLGIVANDQGDYATARKLYEESLALDREMGDKWGIAVDLNNLGLVAMAQGDYVTARALYEESLLIDRELGDKEGIAADLSNLGVVAIARGNPAEAREYQEEALVIRREIGDRQGIAGSLNIIGLLNLDEGSHVESRRMLEESLALSKEMDSKSQMGFALFCIGLVDLAENKPEAREHNLDSLRLHLELGEKLAQTSNLVAAAGWVLHEGNPRFAAELLGAVESALKGLNAVVDVGVKFFHEGTLAKVKDVLGDAAFQSAREEGARWSLEEAVKKVLGE